MHDGTAPSSLPEQLHAATREKHGALNTQILTRLPLCLPPHADRPLNYTKGMTIFGQIYFAFEHFLERGMDTAGSDQRMHTIYTKIYIPQLLRTQRLRNDIEALNSTLQREEVDELHSLEQEAGLIHRRITDALSAKPHVMLAYAWTMYLALFNGGRWIQRQLMSTGDGFWQSEVMPLSFWTFENGEGGLGNHDRNSEELKIRFKTGFAEAVLYLKDEEQQEVIEEATRLFELCSEMVAILDCDTISKKSSIETSPVNAQPWPLSTNALLGSLRVCAESARSLLKTTARMAWRDKLASPG